MIPTQADKLIAGCGKSCGYRIDEEQLRKVLVHCGDLVNGKKHYGSECKSNAQTLAETLNEQIRWCKETKPCVALNYNCKKCTHCRRILFIQSELKKLKDAGLQ